MLKRAILAIGLALLMGACTPKPADEDVRAVLQQNLPLNAKAGVALDTVQTDIASAGDDQLVKFKSTLKASEPLFVQLGFDEAAQAAAADVSGFDEVDKALALLSSSGRERLSADVAKATEKPIFLKQTATAGAASEWYGSFKVRRVVDKWVPSDFRTDVEPKLLGQPRSAFPSSSLQLDGAKAWFADARLKQEALLQRLADAKALEDKDAQLVQQATEAQQARQEKDSLLAEQQKRMRQLPLRVQVTKAILGNSKVLLLQVAQPMTVRLDVVRGAQNLSRQLQLQPGRAAPFGHLEGWGFQSGDRVTLSNPKFDPLSFTVP